MITGGLDVLRSRKNRAVLSYENRLPDLVVTVDDGAAPEDDAVLAESVGPALPVVLDTLTPAERRSRRGRRPPSPGWLRAAW
ncbi:hypothetical protein [Streptomyces sp. NPDC056144]|uniref:hypothetical protein n=1 Tax=unclassified Streptomyces TaxID=2593676 RepID=UPI0035E34F28